METNTFLLQEETHSGDIHDETDAIPTREGGFYDE